MSSEFNDPKTGLKIRKLTELKPTAAKEYQDAMLNRINYFSNQGKSSIFNNQLENAVVQGVSALLNLKVKLDEALDEKKRNALHSTIEKLLLLGL